MLNVPSSIKALYQIDGVRKNFRVHFVYGEFADITNANVLQETVKFTESVCSQSTFRFGLAEASVLEFEAVDIPNIIGKIIDAGIEIDISSLSAADIAIIEAGTWNGTLVKAAQSDLGYGYFRIPYGRFQIDSCPRNNGAMSHRQVTAYSVAPNYYAIMAQFHYSYDPTDPTIEELVQGALEVNAMFLKADRLGGHEIMRLDNSSPLSVVPSSYESVWWDEYSVDTIGTVTVTYKTDEQDNTVDIAFAGGQSKYTMTENLLLQNLTNADYNSVLAILQSDFFPNIWTAYFTPIELTMQGWPWLEAGDALQITAADGTIINSYALNVEISGIINPKATITADGGTIIEEAS